jgi:putative ABC transport system permease protein
MSQKMGYATLIVASIRNKPGRNIATLFCFAFIAANIFSGQFLIEGASGGLNRSVSRMGADHLVVPSQYMVFLRGAGSNTSMAIVLAEPSNYRIKANITEKIGKIQGVSLMSPQLYVSTLNVPGLSSEPLDIYGFDPSTDFTIQPWLQKPLNSPLRNGEVIVGYAVKGDVSTLISIGSKPFKIVGKLDPTRSSIDRTIFLRMEDAYMLAATPGIVPSTAPRIYPGDINALLIQDSNGEDLNSVAIRIRRLFSLSPEYKYVSVIGRHFTLDPVAEDIQAIPALLNLISVFVVIIALPLTAVIAAMVTHERQREIGLLMAMGAKRNAVFFLVIAESLVLAAIGGIVGVGVCLFAFFLMYSQGVLNSALQVSFQMPSGMEIGYMAGLALLVIITLGSISSLWPGYRSSMMNPYDAIRNEGM